MDIKQEKYYGPVKHINSSHTIKEDTVRIYVNGLLLSRDDDYTLSMHDSGKAHVVFNEGGNTPSEDGDIVTLVGAAIEVPTVCLDCPYREHYACKETKVYNLNKEKFDKCPSKKVSTYNKVFS